MSKVSYSQYTMWSSCPHQWRGIYILKLLKSESSIHSVFGTAMHETVQWWLDIVFNGSMIKARTIDLSDILKEHLIRLFTEATIELEEGEKLFLCDKQTLMEFYEDGVAILKYLQINVEKYYQVKEWKLSGIETPIQLEVRPNIMFRGFLDVVLRHKLTGMIKIIDLKTSTRGWGKWMKGDKSKTDQLLIYKRYYAQQYDVPENAIGVDFHILRRKLPDHSDWPIPRVSKFAPAHGKPSMVQSAARFDSFLDSAFDSEGNHVKGELEKKPSKSSCRFCPFVGTEHCDVGVAT